MNLYFLDISNFDGSNLQFMFRMFESCKSLKTLYISHFNTEYVDRMDSLFQDCTNLEISNLPGSKQIKLQLLDICFQVVNL